LGCGIHFVVKIGPDGLRSERFESAVVPQVLSMHRRIV
jgi:hypothetical protein